MAVLKRIPGRPNSPRFREVKEKTHLNIETGALNKTIFEEAALTYKALTGQIDGNDTKYVDNFKTVLDRYAYTALAIEEAYSNYLILEDNNDLNVDDIDDSTFDVDGRYNKYSNIHSALLCKVIEKIGTDINGIAYGGELPLIVIIAAQAARDSSINTDNVIIETITAHRMLLDNTKYTLNYIDNLSNQIVRIIKNEIIDLIDGLETHDSVVIIDILSLFANVTIHSSDDFTFNSVVSLELWEPQKLPGNDDIIIREALSSLNDRISYVYDL